MIFDEPDYMKQLHSVKKGSNLIKEEKKEGNESEVMRQTQ